MIEKIKKLFKTKKLVTVIWVAFMGLVIIGLIIEHPEILSGKFSKAVSIPTTQIIISPTIAPTVETTLEEVKTNDPIVQCQLNECGVIEMKSSQCRLSGCCVIGTQYKVMTDQAECTRLQNDYAQKIKTTQKTTEQKDLILKNAQNNANYFSVQTCLDQVKYEADRCQDSCLGESNERSAICRPGMDNLDWDTARYTECLDEASSMHDDCGNACLSQSQTKSNECLAQQKQ